MNTSTNTAKHNDSLPEFPAEDGWGFAGIIYSNGWSDTLGDNRITEADAEALWFEAAKEIKRAFGGTTETIRNFLRSKSGRHLADEVYNQAYPLVSRAALKKATRRAVDRQDFAGRSWWKRPFNEVASATARGTWEN